MSDSKELALSVAALAGWQLLQAYNTNAPSLSDVRNAPANDPATKRQLLDADFLVGGMAVIMGSTIAIMTHDKTALIVLTVMFGSTSLLHHAILSQESTYAD